MRIAGLVLAAGLSSRMGFYKPLAEIGNKKMIDWTIDSMLLGGVCHVVVVLGHNRELMESYLTSKYPTEVTTVFNENYVNGNMFDSVKTGLPLLKNYDAFYLLLADMPAVNPKTFKILLDNINCSDKKIILPTVKKKRKHPPLLSSDLIEDIYSYEGANGLRGYWTCVSDKILEIEVDDPGCCLDADTVEDFEIIKTYLENN